MLESIKIKYKTFMITIKRWIDTTLQGTHDHYSCYLPGNISSLSSFILKRIFSGVKVDKIQTPILNNIQKDAIVVYVTKHKSYLEYLFYQIRYKQEGFPFPEIGFDYKVFLWQPLSRIFKILLAHLDFFYHNLSFPDPYKSGYIKQELINGRSALLSLVEKKGFYRRFVKAKTDPIRYLIEMQKSIDRPIYIIPQLMFFSKKPDRSNPTITDILFGTEAKPGKIRQGITLFKSPGKVFIEISDPVNLKDFLKLAENPEHSYEYLSLLLRRNLLFQINRHRQNITGPVLKSREELKEDILTNDRIQKYMDNYSETRGIPIKKVRKEANSYLEEIAAKYNIDIIKITAVVIRWLTGTMFEGVVVNNDALNRIKRMYQEGPLIFVPCHKSHIDYLILSYIMFENNLPCPHIAAGKNLSFWPLGPIFRGGGAFFIRRTFKGSVLYSKIFAEYIRKLLEEGFNIEFFIEGGRSRTGKLMLPKLGLLSILLNAYKDGACEDMILVPVYIGYDRVMEESSYLHEIEGGQKKPESLLQIFNARKLLKKRYGKIYIKFHEPVSLNKVLSQAGTPVKNLTSKALNTLCRNVGHRIINAINRITVVTAQGLVASALLNCSRKRFSVDHLMSIVETYTNYLVSQNAHLSDTLLLDHDRAVEQTFDSYIQLKFVESIMEDQVSTDKKSLSSDTQFMVNVNKRPVLEYYKNNCIAYFIPAAFTATAILEKDTFQFSASDLYAGYTFLQKFFKNEFAYDVDRTPEDFVQNNIKAFVDNDLLTPHQNMPDNYSLTSAGYKKLKNFSAFLKTYFESYWIVLNFFMHHPPNSVEVKERFRKIQAIGNRMYKNYEIERKEALSKITFENGVDYFISQNIKGSDNNDAINFYSDKIKRYLNILSDN